MSTAEALDSSYAPESSPRQKVIAHFWICSSPFFESTICIAADTDSDTLPDSTEALEIEMIRSILRLYDADGSLCNELFFEFPQNKIGMVELEPLMAGAKLEGGLKHGHLVVSTEAQATHLCRIHSREGACIMSEPRYCSAVRRVFFPILYTADRTIILTFINQSDSPATVRGRLFCGKRSPETSWHVPALGARFVSLANEFQDCFQAIGEGSIQAYLRLGVRGHETVGVQMIDRIQGAKEGSLFLSFS